MATMDVLKRRAVALAGSPAPGDASATARVVSDLCDHVSTLQNAVTALLKQTQSAQMEIAELKTAQLRQSKQM